jgi:RNA polymerase sigma-B factor
VLRNRLIEEHLDLARALARRFANRSEPLDDLEQVAILGVLKAIERYDPERGTPFGAFAVPTVMGELRRHFRDRGWMVRVPRRVQDLHLRIGSVVSELSQQLGRSPTPREIADAAGVRDEDVLEALDAGNRYRPNSLDLAVTGVDADARLGHSDTELGSVEDRATLLELLRRLPEREQRVMYMRYFQDMTQAEIADAIGVSQMHVSRLLTRSLDLLNRDGRVGRDGREEA